MYLLLFSAGLLVGSFLPTVLARLMTTGERRLSLDELLADVRASPASRD